MQVAESPTVEEDGQHDCPICDADAPYVLYDGDKMCKHCGHVPGSSQPIEHDENEWETWRSHRDSHYSGFTGEDRIKFPGGFASAYDFGDDFDVSR